ncbi:MAG: lysoplasmalogenase [Chitinophagaceae bacterium]|nr:lysoplasmalogenase [Chitinophagaceae bacterium]
MNKRSSVLMFVIVLASNIIGGLLKEQWLEYCSKPLIIISLIVYFLLQTKGTEPGLKKWVLFALIFSWMGDVLLMFQVSNAIFFLLGLSAFLIAHIFYIILFHLIRIKENIKSNLWLLLGVVVYYAALITFLSPYLGDMKQPVRIYGLVISFMFMLAMHMLYIKDKAAGRRMMMGALLFVVSDSVLAANKFYQSVELAGPVIMLTYGLAQLFIVNGAGRYINVNSRE